MIFMLDIFFQVWFINPLQRGQRERVCFIKMQDIALSSVCKMKIAKIWS